MQLDSRILLKYYFSTTGTQPAAARKSEHPWLLCTNLQSVSLLVTTNMFIFFFCLNNVQYVIYGNSANKQWIELVWVAPLESTKVQRWPQDPYFSNSLLVLHFSTVWKCERTLLSFLIPSSTLVKGLSKEWQKVWQYPDFVRLFHTSTPLRSVELCKEWRGVRATRRKVEDYSHFVRLFTTALASPHLWEVWNWARMEKTLDFMVRAAHGYL